MYPIHQAKHEFIYEPLVSQVFSYHGQREEAGSPAIACCVCSFCFAVCLYYLCNQLIVIQGAWEYLAAPFLVGQSEAAALDKNMH